MSPDGPSKPSPEEKLLRLIRGRPSKAPGGAEAASPAVAADVHAIGGLMGSTLARARPFGSWLRWLTWGLGAVLAVEVGWLVMEATRPLPTIEVPMVDASRLATSLPEHLLTPPRLAESAKRRLFVASVAVVPSPDASRPSAEATKLREMARQLAGRLTLMGVVDGEPPQAIIEDSQTNKTFFVSPGQDVIEGAVLDEVLGDRVILDLEGERITLSL